MLFGFIIIQNIEYPMIRNAEGVLEHVAWDEVYDYIAKRLTEIKKTFGPNAIGGISSSRCTNEENLMQKFIRAVIGTNNIDGCARVCHSPTALEPNEHLARVQQQIQLKI